MLTCIIFNSYFHIFENFFFSFVSFFILIIILNLSEIQAYIQKSCSKMKNVKLKVRLFLLILLKIDKNFIFFEKNGQRFKMFYFEFDVYYNEFKVVDFVNFLGFEFLCRRYIESFFKKSENNIFSTITFRNILEYQLLLKPFKFDKDKEKREYLFFGPLTLNSRFHKKRIIKIKQHFKKKIEFLWDIKYTPSNFSKYILDFNLNSYNILYLRKNKIFNKGRYSRNRQYYRTGVYLCLYINIIAVFGIYFWFYKYSINFGYLWWLFYFFILSFIMPKVILFRLYNLSFLVRSFVDNFLWASQFLVYLFFVFFEIFKNFFKKWYINEMNYLYLARTIIYLKIYRKFIRPFFFNLKMQKKKNQSFSEGRVLEKIRLEKLKKSEEAYLKYMKKHKKVKFLTYDQQYSEMHKKQLKEFLLNPSRDDINKKFREEIKEELIGKLRTDVSVEDLKKFVKNVKAILDDDSGNIKNNLNNSNK